MNLYKFTVRLRLIGSYMYEYQGVHFIIPSQVTVDEIMRAQQFQIDFGLTFSTSVSLVPQIGRPFRVTNQRRNAWYEKGPAVKRHGVYQCFLFRQEGHAALNSELYQGDNTAMQMNSDNGNS